MVSAENFKIRCSSIGEIMTDSRGKTKAEKIFDLKALIVEAQAKADAIREGLKSKQNALDKVAKLQAQLPILEALPEFELSETAKTFCETWVKEQLYERKKEFTSKQTDKGNRVEDSGIAELTEYFGWSFMTEKNQGRLSNDFMQGECDILPDETLVVDLKSSWDCFTFPLFDDAIPDKDYEWQIRGYMELYARERGSVVYLLSDMPEEMIEKELRFKLKEGFTKEEFEKARSFYIYSHLPMQLRVKKYDFTHDPELIEKIKERVTYCRAYIESLLNEIEQ